MNDYKVDLGFIWKGKPFSLACIEIQAKSIKAAIKEGKRRAQAFQQFYNKKNAMQVVQIRFNDSVVWTGKD